MPPEAMQNITELVLSSRRVLTVDGERPATIRVQGGRIVAIEPYDPSQGEDLGSLALIPGLVDTHVHFNEPGRTEWEGFATGTAAAAAGGVTLAVDMPLNSSPVTTTAAALAVKRAAAEGKLSIDVGFYGGLVPDNVSDIESLLDAGVLGIKAFLCHSGIDEFPAATEKELRAAMPLLAERGIPLLAHAEIAREAPAMQNPRFYSHYMASRPPEFERTAIELLIDLCRETGCPTHIVHLADAGSLPMLRDAQSEGLPLTVETCPHYLHFASEQIPDGACQYKCAPPIRDEANREGLWQGLIDGTIDFVASDHSPCPPSDKRLAEGRFDLAWGGISSVQLSLPVLWTGASKRGFNLAQVVHWLSTGPAKLVGRPAGIAVGHAANLVVFDLDGTFQVDAQKLLHRHPVTPYDGETLRGTVLRTYLRGELAAPGGGVTL
jgi:allantoinase